MDRNASLDEFVTDASVDEQRGRRADEVESTVDTDASETARDETTGSDSDRDTSESEPDTGAAEEDDGTRQTASHQLTSETVERGQPRSDDSLTEVVTRAAWVPDSRPCSCCGESVRRLWRADGELVCERCVDWSGTG
jgi:hypothetical protein